MRNSKTAPSSDHHYCLCLPGKLKWGTRAAVLESARWKIGSRITVKFLEGDPTLQERVRDVASQWLTLTPNLEFVFVKSGKADIRIAFQQGNGSWSYLGRACRDAPEQEPTMNFGWLTAKSSNLQVRRVVLHEFGHALGLIHEHQNPKGGIRWKRAAVIKELSGPPNYWSKETIETNIFARHAVSDVTATETDPKSIMMYLISSAWTKDGFTAPQNSRLSARDQKLVRSIYGQ